MTDLTLTEQCIQRRNLVRTGQAPPRRSSRMRICPVCERTHASDSVRAQDRFNPEGPTGYMAMIPGYPIHPTREIAMSAVCQYQHDN